MRRERLVWERKKNSRGFHNLRGFRWIDLAESMLRKFWGPIPVDTGSKLNVHKTFNLRLCQRRSDIVVIFGDYWHQVTFMIKEEVKNWVQTTEFTFSKYLCFTRKFLRHSISSCRVSKQWEFIFWKVLCRQLVRFLAS